MVRAVQVAAPAPAPCGKGKDEKRAAGLDRDLELAASVSTIAGGAAPSSEGHKAARRDDYRRGASTAEERRNPFAARAGSALSWRDVRLTLRAASDGSRAERRLLDGVYGTIAPGEVTAIMGPSGACARSCRRVCCPCS